MVQLQPKSNELKDRLSQLAFGSVPITEFSLAALRRDAEKLRTIDAVSSFLVLGGLCSLTFNDEDADHNHLAAIALSDNSITRFDYAVSLQFLHRRNEAAEQALIAAHLDPLDLTMAMAAVRFLALAGRFRDAYDEYRTLLSRFPTGDFSELPNIPDIIAALDQWRVDETAIQECQKIAFDYLREKRIRAVGSSVSATNVPHDEMIVYAILLDIPKEQVRQLDNELTDRIWDAMQFPGSQQFWIGLEQFHRENEQRTQ